MSPSDVDRLVRWIECKDVMQLGIGRVWCQPEVESQREVVTCI